MHTIKMIFFASAIAYTLSSCNTIGGFGTDMKQGGKAIEKAADKHKSPDVAP